MLNLNHDSEESTGDHDLTSNGATVSAPILNSDGDPIWKVLVFDDLGRDVISSVLRVSDLRTWGVTMHMYVSELEVSFVKILMLSGIYHLRAILSQMYQFYTSLNLQPRILHPLLPTSLVASTLQHTLISSPRYHDPSLKTSPDRRQKLELLRALHSSTINISTSLLESLIYSVWECGKRIHTGLSIVRGPRMRSWTML
jgi:hypothetical protein